MPGSDDVAKQRRKELKVSLHRILLSSKDGIPKSNIWNLLSAKNKRCYSAKYFGVSKMHSLLEEFSDMIQIKMNSGTEYVTLKNSWLPPEASQNQAKGTPVQLYLPPLKLMGMPIAPPVNHPGMLGMLGIGRGRPVSSTHIPVGNQSREPSIGSDADFPPLGETAVRKKSNNSKTDHSVDFTLSEIRGFCVDLLKQHADGLPRAKLNQLCCDKYRLGNVAYPLKEVLTNFPNIFEEIVQNSEVYIHLKNEQKIPCWGTPAKIEKWPEIISLEVSSDGGSDTIDLTSDADVSSSKPIAASNMPSESSADKNVIDLTTNSPQYGFNYPRGVPINSPWMMGQSDPRQSMSNHSVDSVVFGSNTPGDQLLGNLPDFQAKPIIRTQFEKKDIIVKPIFLHRGQRVSKDQLDRIAKECIEMLSDANEHVSMERIEKLLFQRLGIRNIRELGMNDVRYLDQVPSINEHNRVVCRVNAYVQAFIKTRSICTLHELSECLREFVPDRDEFQVLQCGPLQRFPVVYDQFKFPPDDADIPEITSLDILEHIRTYMNKFNKWKERMELQEVMNYIVEQYAVENAYILGVRIRSLPLAAQVLKKAGRDAASSRRTVTEHLKEELLKDMKSVFQKFRASVLQTSSEGEQEIRRHYVQIQPAQAIAEIFSKFNLLMSTDQPTGKSARKHHMKLRDVIGNFLLTVRDDDIARNILHLAICVSNTVLEEAAMEMLAPSRPEESEEMLPQQQQAPPRKDNLLDHVKKYLDRCIAHGSLTLPLLSRIEEKLLEDFEFPSFAAMGFGNFLGFIIKDAKHLLEECGGTVLGSSSGSHDDESIYRPSHTDVLQFIDQCIQAGCSELEKTEAALCSHYAVKESKHLGFGNIKRLVDSAVKPGKHSMKETTTVFEAALSAKSSPVNGHQMRVGILGHKTREAALACLHKCPLLCDLSEWSCWDMLFEPEHGRLRDFIHKYGGNFTSQLEGGRKSLTTDVIALEISPGKLLKLSSQASPELFAEAVQREDVNSTCGLLVSLVVLNKGIENTPVALLANHMKSTLVQLHASVASEDMPSASPELHRHRPDRAVHFVLHCLVKLPVKMAVSLASQIFLDPLGHAVGNSKSKAMLLGMCRTVEEVTRLGQLGCLLGVGEWSNELQKRFLYVPVVVQEISTFEADELFDEPEESEDDSESESLSDSESSFLSDDNDDTQQTSAATAAAVAPVGGSDHSKQQDQVIDESSLCEMESEPDTDDEQNAETDETKDSELDLTADSDMLVSKEDRCHEIIDHIRKEEFGIGIELNEDGQRLMKVQQERLGRSLDRLSKDLYSKDTHFVLELVQNADDNDYPSEMFEEAGEVCPSVKFEMDTDGITVLNNESGFREKNIRALCDVGRSTKGKHKFGYIGQKGIGFKSVFRVTDKPAVHSSGYHICFDVKSGPTGYILPHWVPDKWDIQEGWTTRIELPLKEDIRIHVRSLAARFNDVHPSLLLFLHRLRQIIIENKLEDTVQEMRRFDCGDNIVEIHFNDDVDRWLVVKKLLDASKISEQAKSGVDVESTEIALAFPLRPKSRKIQAHVLPQKQPVFAFLPLRSYGFRFIVQGDFDVPSSREDVDRDSPWNQWIRNEIHTLFIETLDIFRSHPSMSEIEAVTSFLQFVPLEDEILDFFRPVSSQILQKLRARPCVPVQSSNRNLIWKIPSQTVTVRDQLVKEVITPDLLQTHLNLFYLHNDVAAILNPMLTKSLGIEVITTQHILQIGKALSVSWESSQQPENIKMAVAAKLLASVYRSMDEFQQNEGVLETLSSLRMIPLASGEFVAISDSTLFFPFEQTHKDSSRTQDPLMILQTDVRTFHPALLETPDSEVNSQVYKVLLQMGVKQLSPNDVIHHHILPVLKSPQWQEKSREILVSYIVYIKMQWEKNAGIINMEELKAVAQIVTNHGLKNPQETCVHFTPLYGNVIALSQAFTGYDWVLLNDCYVNIHTGNQSQQKIQKWRDFFTQLGVTDFLDIRQQTVHLTSESIDTTVWAPLKEVWPPLADGVTVADWTCPELYCLIKENKDPDTYQRQMRGLCEMLDKGWDKHYSKYTTTQVCNSAGNALRETETSFSIWLRTLSWLPAIQTEVTEEGDGFVLYKERVTVMSPACLYLRSPELEKILAHTVPYVNASFSPTSSFGRFICLKNKIDVEIVKKLLMKWGHRENPSQPSCFCTTSNHIKAVYAFLFENLPPKQLQDITHDNAAIWVPRLDSRIQFELVVSHENAMSSLVVGQMMTREEVWWEDKTGLFNKHTTILSELHSDVGKKRSIKDLYSDSKDMVEFFKHGVKIQSQPSMEEYTELLILVSSAHSVSDKDILPDTLQLYRTIGEKLSRKPDDQTAAMIHGVEKNRVLNRIKNQNIFATKRGSWVSLAEHPLIADSKEYEKLMMKKENIHFLELSDKNRQTRQKETQSIGHDSVLKFMEIVGIKKLSDSIKLEEVTEMFEPCPRLQQFVHLITPILQQYLYVCYPDVYQELCDDDVPKLLANLQFIQVKKLEVRYSLWNRPDIYEIRAEKCYLSNSTFYFHKDHVTSFPDINREIAKFFSSHNERCTRDLKVFLSELTPVVMQQTQDTVEEILAHYDVLPQALPQTEKLWEVPPPQWPVYETLPPLEEPKVMPDQTAAGGETRKDQGGKEKVLTSWPPIASNTEQKPSIPKNSSEEKPASKTWPPPKAPDYMRSVKELPSQFKMAGDDDTSVKGDRESGVGTDKNREGTSSTGGSVSRQHSGQGYPVENGNPNSDNNGLQGKNPHGGGTKTGQTGQEVMKTGSGVEGPTPGAGEDHTGQHEDSGGQQSAERGQGGQDPSQKSSGRPTAAEFFDDSTSRTDMESESPGHPRKRQLTDDDGNSPLPSPKKPAIYYGQPIWTETASEYSYEKLGTGRGLPFPTDMKLDTGVENPETGKWGEILVYHYLLKQKDENPHIMNVIWCNETQETGLPYDIAVHCCDEHKQWVVYIEVKSTTSDTKEFFEISSKQVQFAQEKKEHFHIYRIFSAGDPENVQLLRIDNLSLRLDQSQVRLCMLL